MRISITHDILTADAPHARHQEIARPDIAAAALVTRGHSPAIAAAIAYGELSSSTKVRSLANRVGLTTVDTAEARERGLVR